MQHFSLKVFFIACSTIITGIAAMWSWRNTIPIFIEGNFRSPEYLIIPVLLLLVAAVVYSLASLFIEERVLLYGTLILTAGTPYLFIPSTLPAIIGLVASALLISFATSEIRKEKFLSIGFNGYKFLKAGLPIYFTVSAVTISFFFISYINTKDIIEVILPSPALEFLLERYSGKLEPYTGIPEIHRGMTVSEILRIITVKQLRERGIDEKDIPETEVKQLIEQERRALEMQYKIELDLDADATTVIQRNVFRYVNNILGPYQHFFPLASALIFFFTLKTLTLPIFYFTILLAFFAVRFLTWLNVISEQQVMITVKRLRLTTTTNDKGLLSNPRSAA